MLKAGPRALPRCADGPDPLAALDTVPHPHGDLGEVAIDRAMAVIMVDHDDQTGALAFGMFPMAANGALRGRVASSASHRSAAASRSTGIAP